MPDLSNTDLRAVIRYLEDATKLYDALAAIPMQKAACRGHMIRQLVHKLKNKLPSPSQRGTSYNPSITPKNDKK